MQRTIFAAGLALAVAISGCSGLKANSTFNPEFNFSGPKTYAWRDQEPLTIDGRRDDITHQRIVRAVDAEMTNKGFAEQTDAYYHIAFYVGVQSIPQATTTGGYYGGGWGRGWGYGWGGGMGMSTTTVRYYDEASLTLDVLDARSGSIIWRGTVKGTVDENHSQEKRDEQLRQATQKMLADFPPSQ